MDETKLLADLKPAEGLKLKAYQDSKGIWTIGYGRNLQTMEIPQSLAELWLKEDIEKAYNIAKNTSIWPKLDTPARQNAYVELIFNMGLGKVMQFVKMNAAIHRQDWQEAARELLDSKWKTDVGPVRSNRVAAQILTGNFPV